MKQLQQKAAMLQSVGGSRITGGAENENIVAHWKSHDVDKRTARARCYWAWDCHTCDRQNLSEYEDTHVAKCNHCGASVSVEIVDTYAADLAAEATRLAARVQELEGVIKKTIEADEAATDELTKCFPDYEPQPEITNMLRAALRGSEP